MLRLLKTGASGLRVTYLRHRLRQDERYAAELRRCGMLTHVEQGHFDRGVEALRVDLALAESEHQRLAS